MTIQSQLDKRWNAKVLKMYKNLKASGLDDVYINDRIKDLEKEGRK